MTLDPRRLARVPRSASFASTGAQRCAHWANAVLFGILMATALPLYFGSLAGVIGRRHLMEEIHLWAGHRPAGAASSSPSSDPGVPGCAATSAGSTSGPGTRSGWLRTLGRRAIAVVDKFNPGQKLNAIFIGGAIVVMLATGSIMQWFRSFPVSWRTGATFVHDVLALAIFVVVFGHMLFALTHPDSLRSMIKGWVTEAWAARHAPGWLAEEQPQLERERVS